MNLCPKCDEPAIGPVGSLEGRTVTWEDSNGHQWTMPNTESAAYKKMERRIKPHCVHQLTRKGPNCTPSCGWTRESGTKTLVKHTPGPWEVGTGWIFHKTGERMAGGGGPIREEVCRVLTNDVGDANARLIAAAPEMMNALKAILAITARNGGGAKDAEALTAIEQLAAVAVRDGEGK